jgi:hypothetical protein
VAELFANHANHPDDASQQSLATSALTAAVRRVLQRVSSASVTVGERVVGAIGSGLLASIGIEAGVARRSRLRRDQDPDVRISRRRGQDELVRRRRRWRGAGRRSSRLRRRSEGETTVVRPGGPPAEAKLLYEDTVRALRETGARRDRRVSGDDAGGARE